MGEVLDIIILSHKKIKNQMPIIWFENPSLWKTKQATTKVHCLPKVLKTLQEKQVVEQHRIHSIKNTNMDLESKILIQYQWTVILTQLIQQ